MFTGEFHHNLDEKNRLIIPSKMRMELDTKIVITRGLDGCLFGYNLSMWKKLMDNLSLLPFTKKDARYFLRFFSSGATTLEFDRQGRIVIPNYLKDYADIKTDVVIVGVSNRIEIWSLTKWNQFMMDNIASLSDISENLFDSNIEL